MNDMPRIVAVLCALALPGFAAVDTSKLPPPSKQTGVTYEKDIHPIFDASCVRCHGQDRQKGELRLDSLSAALQGGKHGKAIVPGKSAESPLVHAVARLEPKKAMPPQPRQGRGPGGPGGQPGQGGQGGGGQARPGGQGAAPAGPPPKPLTAEQVGLIRAWIDQGAK